MAIDTTTQRAPDVEAPTAIRVSGPHRVDRQTALARAVIEIVSRALPEQSGLAIVLGGETSVPAATAARIRVNGPEAVARLLWPPTPDNFAEGYLRGDLEIDGDVGAAIEAAQQIDFRRLSPTDLRRLLRYGFELRQAAAPARPLTRAARMSGPLHSRARDLAAIRFHYDVGEDFYRLWLDRRLTYSCAYFERSTDPAADLDHAQEAKLDLVCRKLDLQPGQRLLDIGCGWGSLIVFAAERYGVEAVGVTLSERQANEANHRAIEAGLEKRVRAEVRDYRDLAELGPFDAVASIGMFEHVGRKNLLAYLQAARDAVRPGGRFLNHGIANSASRGVLGRIGVRSSFIQRFVFPDGELVPVETAIEVARAQVGFELLDVQLLRPHYALTLRAWVERLERNWDAAIEAADEEVARTWRLYMSGARLGFERGGTDVAQLLLVKPLESGRPADRPLRPWW
jgi:cyclopropane-fatty-acyl-phospholipid synthase